MALVLAATVVTLLVAPALAGAATITVTTTADENSEPLAGVGCSLREAITAAGTDGVYGGCSVADEDDDTIVLAAGATYPRTLTGSDGTNALGDLDTISIFPEAGPLRIDGNGAAIEGNGLASGDRVIDGPPPGGLFLDDVTIRNGASGGVQGGGIRNNGGILVITNSTITGNRSVVEGGGIALDASQSGHGVFLHNTTVSGNFADSFGGGIFAAGPASSLFLNNVTIADNTADADASDAGDGGGIMNVLGPSVFTMTNTIIAGNHDLSATTVAPDCVGASSDGYNLIGNTANCGYASGVGDVLGAPLLAPLAANGGPTQTHALLAGSPAINAGDPAAATGAPACESSDQRGVARPQSGRCDIGAFEAEPAPPVTTPTTPATPATTKCKKAKKKKGKSAAAAAKKCKKKAKKKKR